jgi:squalene-associated FAD-dependent desaturase
VTQLKCVHVVGAGLAGLAASLWLAKSGVAVELHEAAPQGGGRCRSYFDETIGCRIDNGNHLLMSGNTAAMDYLREIDALRTLIGPANTEFAFLDLITGERWVLRPNLGQIPWWILNKDRRVPDTRASDYVRSLLHLAGAHRRDTVAMMFDKNAAIFRRFWQPLSVAVLNTEVEEASAICLARTVRESFARGGRACLPLVPAEGLSESFVEPAINRLRALGGRVHFGSRLRGIEADHHRISKLIFDSGSELLDRDTAAVIAVPAPVAARIVPGLSAPDSFRAILNAHYRVTARPEAPLFVGLIGGSAQWVFRKREVLSVTISAADGLIDTPAKDLAHLLWPEVRRAYELQETQLPPWQIVKEKRATFAATPDQLARRAKTRTRWQNLALAGDWTDTGLPATIEGAIRSGFAAAAHVLAQRAPG